VKQRPQPTRMACRRADFSVVGPTSVGHGGLKPFPTQGTHVSCLGVSLLNMDVNVKQRPQLTRMACRRADFSVVGPTSVGHGGLKPFPTQGTHVSCLGASLLNMDVNVKQRPQPTRLACRRADFSGVGPTSVGHGGLKPFPTQGTHVSCLGVSLLNMDVSQALRAWFWSAASPVKLC